MKPPNIILGKDDGLHEANIRLKAEVIRLCNIDESNIDESMFYS